MNTWLMTNAQGRPRAKAGLTLDHVVGAAFRVLDAGGVDKLSTRAIARELGVSMNTVMWHIQTKARLMDLMAEFVVARVSLDDLEGPWDRQATELVARLRHALHEHRDGATVLAGTFPAMPATLAFSDRLVSVLLHICPTSQSAAWTAWNLFYFTLGLVQEEQHLPDDALHDRVVANLDPHAFPSLSAVLEHFISRDYDSRFNFGIHQILLSTAGWEE